MRVADAVDAHASAKEVLLEYGLPCSECIVAFHESLAEGCAALRLNIDEVVERLNALA
jgi:hybrid cluster-associated redox disulfide protein